MCDTTMQENGLPDRPVGMTNTIELLERFKRGDEEAVSLLVERSIPPLKRWARGPPAAVGTQSGGDTGSRAERGSSRASTLKTFEAKHPGALQAYLRQAVNNHIRDEIQESESTPAEPPSSRTISRTRGRRRSNGRSGSSRWSDMKRRSTRCARSTVRRSSLAWNCSKATTKSRLPWVNPLPTPRVWPSSGRSGTSSRP